MRNLCRVVGDYVDEGDLPAGLALSYGEPVRPRFVADFTDCWARDDGSREFNVLLKDGRSIAVRGHALKHSENTADGQDVYSVVACANGEEILIALFKSTDVIGIFNGELRSDGKEVKL